MANTLVWESAGAGYAWGGRSRATSAARARSGRRVVSTPAAALRTPARRPRSHRRPLAWRHVIGLAGDVVMVAVWAAMIPGLMWVGAAAGF
jgi:hypothetical protein